MKHPTLIILQNLRKKELVYKESGLPSGFVSIDDAEQAIQDLETKLIMYYEANEIPTEILKQNYDV